MRSTRLIVLVGLLVVAACGTKNSTKPDAHAADATTTDVVVVDAPGVPLIDAPTALPDAPASGFCNVLAQTGCSAGQKCTWIEDQVTPQALGHIGCAPSGPAAIGASCTYGAPGVTGYDNCVKGGVCQAAKCKTICDQNGGTPACGTGTSCSVYEGLFGPAGQPAAAGVCDPGCNPLADNDFLGSGSRPGSACAATQGCYGYPSTSSPSRWSCTNQVNPAIVHRTACTSANGCANASNNAYLNGCAMGYEPLLRDMTGSTQVVCIAVCKPANCYLGHCGTSSANLGGVSPHGCNTTDARGAFNVATGGSTGVNGEQCMFSWLFEVDTTGHLVRSPTSDTVGFCVDHSKYHYDSNADGMINGSDAVWPKCDTIASPGQGSGTTIGAADFGCVDSLTGGVMFTGNGSYHASSLPRMLFHPIAR